MSRGVFKVVMQEVLDHRQVEHRACGWLIGDVDAEGRCAPLAAIRSTPTSDGTSGWMEEPRPEFVPLGLGVVGLYMGCDSASPAVEQCTTVLRSHPAALAAARAGGAHPLVAAALPETVEFFEAESLSPLTLRPAVHRREDRLAEFFASHVAIRARPLLHLQVHRHCSHAHDSHAHDSIPKMDSLRRIACQRDLLPSCPQLEAPAAEASQTDVTASTLHR